MRRVLVTGGTGCVGRHVLPLLVARGWDVHATTSRGARAEIAGVSWHQADLLQHGCGRALVGALQPEALLHLAWFVAPGEWASSGTNLDWVCASLDLVRAFSDCGGTRFVGAGSCLEYDWSYGYCSERKTPCSPHTLYGTSKHALRLLLEGHAAQRGLSIAWGRIFFLYGPHEHPARLVASVIRSLLLGQRARCSHGLQIRDYLYVGDVADAFVRLLEHEVCGPINIASGQPISLRRLATRAGELLGQADSIDFGAIPAASTDSPLVVADVARQSSELGWSPSYDLDRGLLATIDWWREQVKSDMGERP